VAAASCDTGDEFKCWQKEGRKGYASVARLNENNKKFCDQVRTPDNKVGWKSEVSYDEGTPEEHSFLLQLSTNAGAFRQG
jgi:Alpha-galactosyl-binding fungal lectin